MTKPNTKIKKNINTLIDYLKHVDTTKFNMRFVVMEIAEPMSRDSTHVCKTPVCIAGYADFVARGTPIDWFKGIDVDEIPKICMSHFGVAAEFLGLTGNEEACEVLFNNGYKYNNASIQDAINVLEHYRDTGKIEWFRNKDDKILMENA